MPRQSLIGPWVVWLLSGTAPDVVLVRHHSEFAVASIRTSLPDDGRLKYDGIERPLLVFGLVLTGLNECGSSNVSDGYAASAVPPANAVAHGTLVGVPRVTVSAAGPIGNILGAAAGGGGPISAVAAPSGSWLGRSSLGRPPESRILGPAEKPVPADMMAFKCIVRIPNGNLISVAQKDKVRRVLGQRMLVIGNTRAEVWRTNPRRETYLRQSPTDRPNQRSSVSLSQMPSREAPNRRLHSQSNQLRECLQLIRMQPPHPCPMGLAPAARSSIDAIVRASGIVTHIHSASCDGSASIRLAVAV